MFRNRTEAGKELAEELARMIAADPALADPVVLALPRGGLPVGVEVARKLKAPLDLVLVRKIGVPFQPELAAGAIVDGDEPQLVLNQDVLRMAQLTETDLEPVKARELKEIDRRREIYLKGRARAPIEGRVVIVVDDGIATGATTRAALKALQRRKPKSLILAVPVAPVETVEALRGEIDHVVCLHMPAPFYAIGLYYADFGQVSDDEVIRILDKARAALESGKEANDAG